MAKNDDRFSLDQEEEGTGNDIPENAEILQIERIRDQGPRPTRARGSTVGPVEGIIGALVVVVGISLFLSTVFDPRIVLLPGLCVLIGSAVIGLAVFLIIIAWRSSQEKEKTKKPVVGVVVKKAINKDPAAGKPEPDEGGGG